MSVNNREGLLGALARLVDDEGLRRSFRRNATTFVATSYSHETMVDGYIQMYEHRNQGRLHGAAAVLRQPM